MILQQNCWFVLVERVTESKGTLIALSFLSDNCTEPAFWRLAMHRRIYLSVRQIRQPVSRIHFHELGSFKSIFQYMFQLRESGECQKSSLALPSFVGGNCFHKLSRYFTQKRQGRAQGVAYVITNFLRSGLMLSRSSAERSRQTREKKNRQRDRRKREC